MTPPSLSREAAGNLLLAAQGLRHPPAEAASKDRILAAIRRMGLLQIDTISVVARSQHLVLWSRLGDFPLLWLDELHAAGALFEYWSHAACYLPIEEYPVYRRIMLDWRRDGKRGDAETREARDRLLALIRAEGAVRNRDFERAEGLAPGSWWNWKPEKIALEQLFYTGELMIARREGFHRIYDLAERVLPGWDDAAAPDRDAARRALVLRALDALGVATSRWIIAYFPDSLRERGAGRQIGLLLEDLVHAGLAIPIRVEGLEEPAYVHAENAAWLEAAAQGRLTSEVTTVLSPFDPVVSDRARALFLFGFDYRIEIYTPAAKRKFGYFSLPILHRGRLVGRLDAKAHRREGRFEIRSLHLEGTAPEALTPDLGETLVALARWHDTPELVFSAGVDRGLAASLEAALSEPGLGRRG